MTLIGWFCKSIINNLHMSGHFKYLEIIILQLKLIQGNFIIRPNIKYTLQVKMNEVNLIQQL